MDDLIVFRKTWEYLFWLRPTVMRFVRLHKYSLGVEMQSSAVQVLRYIIWANYSEPKKPYIMESIVEIEIQRILLRMAFEYRLLTKRQFEFGSGKLDEIGRLLGGWVKVSS